MTRLFDENGYSAILDLHNQAVRAKEEYESSLGSSGLYLAATTLFERYKRLTGLRTGSCLKHIHLMADQIGFATGDHSDEPDCTYDYIPARFLWEDGWEAEIANINYVAGQKLTRLFLAAEELKLTNFTLETSAKVLGKTPSELENVLIGNGLPKHGNAATQSDEPHRLLRLVHDTERLFQNALNQRLSSLGLSNI